MAFKRVSTIHESENGRNELFRDNYTKQTMNRTEFVSAIQNGDYSNYHVRNINGVLTPCSNPDASTNNNLN